MPLKSHPLWRLIPLLEGDGRLQMAIDSWILKQHRCHNHPPTLRFYTWNPPAISLGRHQKKHLPPHWHTIPLPMVRRPTGGRAVLHQGDLCYAVITSVEKGSLYTIYREISQFLIEGWRRLGLQLHFGSKQYCLSSPNCFHLATAADLVDCRGGKLIGSAILKQGDSILQHGSMLLSPNPQLFEQVFQSPPPQPLIPPSLSLPQIIHSLTAAARDCFRCQFLLQPLSPKEMADIITHGELPPQWALSPQD
ncbi:MAG: lipoate--protein ligase family protein [Geminocystis sp.]|nr:lipoate--protein ligase family protein [Geminocystis sp.]HIK38662.1 lipoate--protein ligase family protein [Geminocystis sp. M7585_C2015_104]MCS7147626.1 lipoate--protein ligase family protein [Geminocystis sp.]MCX8078029.1 lipoate--protein ligase family protein [Geminocystis sp.]MDW8115319.1 lipoate--protein ligase family protein [Geminocystis sp.]